MSRRTKAFFVSQQDSATPTTPRSSLLVNVKELYNTGLYSDLTIHCNGREYKVHKLMLHTQSSYFSKLLSGKFKESAQNENTSTLTLDNDEPEVLEVLLHHLYHFTYSDASRGEQPEGPFTVRVYACADKYDVPSLRAMAASTLTKRVALIADPAVGKVDEFIATITSIEEYTSPSDGRLWDIVIPKIRENMASLLEDGDDRFFSLLAGLPELTKVLLKGSGGMTVEGGGDKSRSSRLGHGMAMSIDGGSMNGDDSGDEDESYNPRADGSLFVSGRAGWRRGPGRRLG